MYDILGFSEEERLTIFRNTAQRMGVHEAIVEKDYWASLMLDYLFHKSEFRKKMIFKGCTSLSKCFGLINRFSEDIDLILDWRLLGYRKDEPWQERSKTKQDAFNKEANERAEIFLAEQFLPAFTSDVSDIIGKAANAEIEKNDLQTISFHYPKLFSAEAIMPSIRLEIGALAAWTPAVEKTISPYIYEYYPLLSQATSTLVATSSAERTFWEKATILHHESNRPESSDMPMRYSRHYYDLFCIANSEYKKTALNQLNLLQRVIEFKMKFYPRAWAKYNEALPDSIKLVPPNFRLNALRNDYGSMAEMLFGKYPSFDDLMGVIGDLETEINHIK